MNFFVLIASFLLCITPHLSQASTYCHTAKNSYQNDISCCIADIKFDGERIFICEFGEGIESRFKGYDALYGTGSMWRMIWQSLANFNMPLHYIGTTFLEAPKTDKTFAYDTFKHYGRTSDTLADFTKYCSSKKMLSQKHMVIAHSIKQSAQSVYKLQEPSPDLIIFGKATSKHVRSKQATNRLFVSPFLKQFKPATLEIEKKYSPALAAEIIEAIPSDFYVIKPPCCALGQGVILIPKEELDRTLKLIIDHKKELSPKNSPSAYRYWEKDKSASIMVEAFASSKTIMSQGKPFDATLRAVFIISNLNGTIGIQHLGAYWKLPIKSLTETGSFMEKHKSSISSSRVSSAPVDVSDYKIVCEQLNLLLPVLYEEMLKLMPNNS